MDDKTIGECVRALRIMNEKSVVDCASASGINISAWRRLEQCHVTKSVSEEALNKGLKFIGVTDVTRRVIVDRAREEWWS